MNWSVAMSDRTVYYLFLKMVQTSVGQSRPLHVLVTLGVSVLPVVVPVAVHALVADVVCLHVVPLPHVVVDQLLHLNKIDGGGVAGAVGSPDAQVLRLLVADRAVGGVALAVAQGRGPGLAQVEAAVDAVATPPPWTRLLPSLPSLLAGPVVMVSAAQGTALITVTDLVTRLSVSVMRRGTGTVSRPASAVTIGEVGGRGRDADPGRKLVTGGQSSDLEALRRLDEGGQLRLRHGGLALVHEVEDALHLPAPHVLQHHDGMLAGVLHEDLLEVGAARGEDNLVGSDCRILAHDRAVHQ